VQSVVDEMRMDASNGFKNEQHANLDSGGVMTRLSCGCLVVAVLDLWFEKMDTVGSTKICLKIQKSQ
jgi:hypothetical protein